MLCSTYYSPLSLNLTPYTNGRKQWVWVCPWQQTRRISANSNLFPHTHWACRSQFTFDTKSAEVTQTPVVMAPSLRSAHISSVYHNLGVTYMCDQLTVNSDILWLNSHVEQVIRIAHRNWDPLLISSVQSLSRVRLCNTMNGSTPGLLVHDQHPESTQTHVH